MTGIGALKVSQSQSRIPIRMNVEIVRIFAILFWTITSTSIACCIASLLYYTYLRSARKFPFHVSLYITTFVYHITRFVEWPSFYNGFYQPLPPYDPNAFDFYGFSAYLLTGQVLISSISIFNVNSFGKKLVSKPKRQHLIFYITTGLHFAAHLIAAFCQRFDVRAKEYVLVPTDIVFGIALSLMLCMLHPSR